MNAAVIHGSNTSFQCSANKNSSFRWFGNLLESNGTVAIHTGNNIARDYKSMYSYKNGTNSSTLIIKSVNASHAGTYICVATHPTKNSSAELIVLGMYINSLIYKIESLIRSFVHCSALLCSLIRHSQVLFVH